MFFEPDNRDRALLPHDPFKALVAPRPIGWISTRSLSGAVNLAPYSFFNAICGAPPLLAFSSEGAKDSASFAQESGEFVWNMANFALREAMNASSASLPREHLQKPGRIRRDLIHLGPDVEGGHGGRDAGSFRH